LKTHAHNAGGDSGRCFGELKTEVAWLHGSWMIYQQLFLHSKKRTDMLNECAGALFYIVQDTLLADIQRSCSG
jgi:hypothetical protein